MSFLEVAVASPIAATLTYSTPKSSTITPVPGLRLLVPLGSRQVTGYLLACLESLPTDNTYKIRPISDYLDNCPLFPAAMVPFFRWLANYYQYPIGEIIKSALPTGLTPQSGRLIITTDAGRAYFNTMPEAEWPGPWFAKFLRDGRLSANTARKLWRTEQRKLEKWAKDGLLDINPTISTDTIKEKTELCVRLNAASLPSLAKLKLSEQRTLTAISCLAHAANRPWISNRDLAKEYPGSRKALASLAAQQRVLLDERQVYRDPFGEQPPFYPEPVALTSDQQGALTELAPAIQAMQYAPFLLHGITGSGKTEVYLRATALALDEGRDVLVLVPEIALATQIEGNFLSRFGDRIAILHSGLTDGERFDQWKRICTGQAKVVIGARSALFAPLANLGLIIVDEEHDGAYKQEDNFRYNARDAAVMRANQCQAVILLGSATPSIISYYHGSTGKYRLLSLPKRVAERSLPAVEVVDLKTVPTISGKPPLFSPQLINAVKETLNNGDQSLIFLNRRGFASLLLCRDCGHTMQCAHCNISLTLHQKSGKLICHYCGFSIKSAAICPQCQSPGLTAMGFGTERIEDELRTLLPKATIGRLDRDTTSSRHNYLTILKSVHQREIDILIGTQMITKGHHFPHVTMVGVVWADSGLGIPDYKAGERTFQLLTQVFGRAGRGEKPGRVIVQTYHPEHYSITNSQTHDYESLYQEEIRLRRRLSFPPFSRLVNIRIEGTQAKEVEKIALYLGRLAKQQGAASGIDILGPAPAPIHKIRDTFRWQLLAKSANLKGLHTLCASLAAMKPSTLGASSVKLLVDVDPESMV